LLHAVQRLRNMRRQHAVSVHQIVVKESIGRLQFSGRQRLRQRRMWTGRQLACQRNQSLRQASVPEIRLREFLACPVRRVVPGRQSAFAASTEWAKVNTVRSSLQPDLWVKLRPEGRGFGDSLGGVQTPSKRVLPNRPEGRLWTVALLPHVYFVTEHPETQVLFEYCAAFTPHL